MENNVIEVNPKRIKTGGRKAGVPNKLTQSVKECIEQVHRELGGAEAMLQWAKTNPDLFYSKILTKLLPTGAAGTKDDPIRHEFIHWVRQLPPQ